MGDNNPLNRTLASWRSYDDYEILVDGLKQ